MIFFLDEGVYHNLLYPNPKCFCFLDCQTWKDHLSGVRHKLRESERSTHSFPPPKRPSNSDCKNNNFINSILHSLLTPQKRVLCLLVCDS